MEKKQIHSYHIFDSQNERVDMMKMLENGYLREEDDKYFEENKKKVRRKDLPF